MIKRKKLTKIKSKRRLADSTRRRISRKSMRAQLTKRRLKQISMSLVDPVTESEEN